MSANIDRRTFLAGTTAGSLVLLSLGGCNKPDENKGAIKTSAGSDSGQAKPHYAMVFDQNKCIGCGLCTTKCAFDAIHLDRDRPECSTMVKYEQKLPSLGKYALKRAIKIKFGRK